MTQRTVKTGTVNQVEYGHLSDCRGMFKISFVTKNI